MNIELLAPWYRAIEYCAFGKALERRRFAFLSRLEGTRSILVAGEGDGRALVRLLAAAPEASVDVVESSRRMIALAKKRVGDTNRVRFVQSDARSIEIAEGRYDGVVTCFFLDCFSEDEARGLIGRLVRSMAPGGVWLISDFVVPARGWRHWHARIWMKILYCFFRVTTGLRTRRLPPVAELLSREGLELMESEAERAGMLLSQVWRKRGPQAG